MIQKAPFTSWRDGIIGNEKTDLKEKGVLFPQNTHTSLAMEGFFALTSPAPLKNPV